MVLATDNRLLDLRQAEFFRWGHAMAAVFPPSTSLYTPLSRDGTKMFFLRQGASCWLLLFTTPEAARAYRAAAGITERCNSVVYPDEAVANMLRYHIGLPGNNVVGALLDPTVPSPGSGSPVPLDQLMDWVEGRLV